MQFIHNREYRERGLAQAQEELRTAPRARVRLLAGENDMILVEFHTAGKPVYGIGYGRKPDVVNFCVMPFSAPASPNDYHVSKTHQTMIWFDYDPVTRIAQCVTIPPQGKIEIAGEA